MAAAAVAEPPSSTKVDDLPSPSPSPSASPSLSPFPSPTQSPSPSSPVAATSAAADMTANADSSPEPDPSSPTKSDSTPDPAPPAAGFLSRLPPPQALFLGGAASHHSSTRRLPPPCWTQEETDALIQSYRQKWYALRRGNLRASHWEEVAEAVALRCRHLYTPGGTNSPKTAVQCRHKMEKLRKRYRSEKKRPHRTSWVHFRDMDAMEMGTLPGGGGGGAAAAGSRSKAVATAGVPGSYSDNEDDESDDDDDEDDEDGQKRVGGNPSTRSIHAVMSKANGMPAIGDLRFQIPKAVRSKVGTPRADDRANPNNAFNPKSFHASGSNGCFKGFPAGSARKQPSAAEEMRNRLEERRRKEREGAVLGEMVAAVRMLGDGFMRVEETKMEMAREMEKLRMEMELKRTEMIIESQRWIVDAIVKGLGHGKKRKRAKIAPES